MAISRRLDHIKKTRRRDSRGATLVESALVLAPMMLLFFAIIEFGILFKDILGISNAARAGTRVASAVPSNWASPSSALYADTKGAVARNVSGVQMNQDAYMCMYQVRKSGPAINADGDIKMSDCGNTDPPGNHSVRFRWQSGTWVHNRGPAVIAWEPSDNIKLGGPTTCLGDPQFDAIGVSIQVKHHSISGMFPSYDINQHSTMRFEPQINAQECRDAP